MYRKLLYIILFLFFSTVSINAASYYIDPDWDGEELGTYLKPWNSFSDITGMVSGDDIYIKYGTEINESLEVTWTGLSANPSVIGCYDGNGDFDCTGKTLPIIHGDRTIVGEWTEHASNEYYTTVEEEVYAVYQNDSIVRICSDWNRFVADGPAPSPDTMFEIPESGNDMTYSSAQIAGADVVMQRYVWQRMRFRVESYSAVDDTIYLVDDGRWDTGYGAAESYKPYYFSNKEFMLDEEDEWFYCSSSHTNQPCATGDNRLYFYQTGGGSPTGTITYTALENGIEIDNKDYITIQELEIKKFYQNGIFATGGAHHIIIGNNTADRVYIHHIGSQKYFSAENQFDGNCIGVQHTYGVTGDHADDSVEVKNTKMDLCLDGGYHAFYYANSNIHDNNITNIGIPYLRSENGWGIRVNSHYSRDFGLIEDNVLDNIAYCGIIAGDNSGDYTGLIDGNNISNFCVDLIDGGGIYIVGQDTRITISNNTISTCARLNESTTAQVGIYLDSGANQNTMDNNTVDATGCTTCFLNNKGGNNTWTNNECSNYRQYGLMFLQSTVDGSDEDGFYNMTGMVATGNSFKTDDEEFMYHVYIKGNIAADTPHTDWFDDPSDFDNNVYCSDGSTAFVERIYQTDHKYNFAGWKAATGLDLNSTMGEGEFCWVKVSNVSPADNETGVALDKIITWTNPSSAITLDLYFDTTDGTTPIWTNHALQESYDPGLLSNDEEYFFRIDVDHAEGTQTGDTYSFETMPEEGAPPLVDYGSGSKWK